MLGHIDLACDRRDSRHFLPRLGPSQMAGFFTSQCFHQGLSKATIKKGDIITIKPQWQDAGNARFTWVARNDEENGRVDISAVELAFHGGLAGADRSQRHDRGLGPPHLMTQPSPSCHSAAPHPWRIASVGPETALVVPDTKGLAPQDGAFSFLARSKSPAHRLIQRRGPSSPNSPGPP